MLVKNSTPSCNQLGQLLERIDYQRLIVRDLLSGTKRFNELMKSLGLISQKVLTQNLRILEENELINRVVYPVVSPKVEYSLTKLGFSLKPILDSMDSWEYQYKKLI